MQQKVFLSIYTIQDVLLMIRSYWGNEHLEQVRIKFIVFVVNNDLLTRILIFKLY